MICTCVTPVNNQWDVFLSSGLLRVGDIVKEVNGIAVFVPEDMMIVLKEAENSITFKIVPSALDQQFSDPVRQG